MIKTDDWFLVFKKYADLQTPEIVIIYGVSEKLEFKALDRGLCFVQI